MMGAYTRSDARHRRRPAARVHAVPAPPGAHRARWPARCRAASSRCWRSAARSWRGRGCSCSTSPPWAWPRCWSSRSSRRSATINRQGTTILLVEQNAAMALSIAHRGYVLETGRIVLDGHRRRARREPRGPPRLPRRVTRRSDGRGATCMKTQGVTFESTRSATCTGRSARTVSETDIVNFVNLCGFTEPLFMDMEYVKRESVFGRRAAPGRPHLLPLARAWSCRPASSTAPAWPGSAARSGGGARAGGRHHPRRGRGGRQARDEEADRGIVTYKHGVPTSATSSCWRPPSSA